MKNTSEDKLKTVEQAVETTQYQGFTNTETLDTIALLLFKAISRQTIKQVR